MRTLPHLISQLLQIYNIYLQKSSFLPFYSYDVVDWLIIFIQRWSTLSLKLNYPFL